MPSIPWYLVQGNHDYLTNPSAQMEHHYLPDKDPRWNMPGYVYTKTMHSDAGDNAFTMQLVFLDTVRLADHHFDNPRHKMRGHVRLGHHV